MNKADRWGQGPIPPGSAKNVTVAVMSTYILYV